MCLTKLSLALALPLGLAASAAAPALAPPAARAPLGAPTLCVPFEIGEARSLPLAKGQSGRSSVAPEALLDATIAALDASGASLVHMETIRRAVLTLADDGWWPLGKADERREARALVARLRARVDAAERAAERDPARQGLAWFDLGYALATLEQAGLRVEEGKLEALSRAAALRPDDGGVHLGIALASWTKQGDEALRKRAFLRAAELGADPQGLLHKNVMAFARHFLGVRTYDELLAKVRA